MTSTENASPTTRRSVLFVYYSYTEQARLVAKAMTDTLTAAGCDVTEAQIKFTDKRYTKIFDKFPMNNGFLDVLRMLPAQARRATGEIEIPDAASKGGYDLVIVGSPTWWLTTSMPMRSYLHAPEAKTVLKGTPFAAYVVCRRYWKGNMKTVKHLGTKAGGRFVDGLEYKYEGGQVRSLMSLVSFLGSGEYRHRYFGVKIPKTNLQPNYETQAATFATGLVEKVTATVT